MTSVYVDTSALAKLYLPEDRSDDVDSFLRSRAPVLISSLTVTEMRSLLARRRREGGIDINDEVRVFAVFEDDVRKGHLVRAPLRDNLHDAAAGLITSLPDVALRTLDALHLAVVQERGLCELATADAVMLAAGRKLGLVVHDFRPMGAR